MTAAVTIAARLAPVRGALLADAAATAEEMLARATAERDETVARAEGEVATAVEQARHRAEVSARAHADEAIARARREATTAMLRCEAELRQELVDAVDERLARLRDGDRYPRLLDGLERLAKTQLGDSAVIERDAAPDGGVVASVGGRSVDYRLGALARRAVDALAADWEASWQ